MSEKKAGDVEPLLLIQTFRVGDRVGLELY